MITTGDPIYSATYDAIATKTEIVDVVSRETKTCANLADFPFPIFRAFGGNLHATPFVCGGQDTSYIYYQTCYKFTTSGWQEFASMKEKRYSAAGIMYQNMFHVFGGAHGLIRSQTSELISIDGGVEYGPELPTAVRVHAITSINSTVSILSGGDTNANHYSRLTWYFNHETNIFSAGPSLLEGRFGHGSATCVDKVTKAKIPIVTGGYGDGGIDTNPGYYLDSTEMLINEQWQSGTIQCTMVLYSTGPVSGISLQL